MKNRIRIRYAATIILNASLVLCFLYLFLAVASSQSTPPQFQSVSGEFAQKWIKDFQETNAKSGPVIKNEDNGSDLWNWGNAPLGSKIVDGNLVTDPYYLRPLLNLSSNWLGETYTDPDTGLPMETYSDPLTGKKIYRFLNPTTSKPFFTYSTYPDAKTGNLVYAYIDPMTGNEVHASAAPIDLINLLVGKMAGQAAYSQNEPWTRL
ncbi:MAG: hypothetical protein PHS80_03475 [Methanothrix sp.]|nr:hypothetical protein [Methanothrix sp.]MDD4446574.1 hypothetical protein [Methanothrix sp.]